MSRIEKLVRRVRAIITKYPDAKSDAASILIEYIAKSITYAEALGELDMLEKDHEK